MPWWIGSRLPKLTSREVLVSSVARQSNTSSSALRPFIRTSLSSDHHGVDSSHITSDEILTWNQIHQAVAEAAGCPANIVHIPSDFITRCEPSLTGTLLGDKAVSVIFDNTKIKRFVPDFRATIPFAQGIKRTLAWFETDPARKIVRKETDEMMDRILRAYQQAFSN